MKGREPCRFTEEAKREIAFSLATVVFIPRLARFMIVRRPSSAWELLPDRLEVVAKESQSMEVAGSRIRVPEAVHPLACSGEALFSACERV